MILIVISGLTEVWNLHFIEEIKKINLLSHFQKPISVGGNCSVMERDSFDERPYTMPFFLPIQTFFFRTGFLTGNSSTWEENLNSILFQGEVEIWSN